MHAALSATPTAAGKYVPGAHASHWAALASPGTLLKRPAGHCRQLAALVAPWEPPYLPASQSMQTDVPDADALPYLPNGHSDEHEINGASDERPAGQAMQEV